jgi:hypothetical protein
MAREFGDDAIWTVEDFSGQGGLSGASMMRVVVEGTDETLVLKVGKVRLL